MPSSAQLSLLTRTPSSIAHAHDHTVPVYLRAASLVQEWGGAGGSASAVAPRVNPVVERLRLLVGARPAPSLDRANLLSSEVAALDAWLHGWPRPGITEIAERPGAGRLAPILPALVRMTRQGRSIVVIDPEQQFRPTRDMDASQVVVVRAPRERAAWAAEQVARSGAVEALLLLDLAPLGRAGMRLARACEAGGMAVFVVSAQAEGDLPAALRLCVDGWAAPSRLRVRCTRSRDGRAQTAEGGHGRVVELG